MRAESKVKQNRQGHGNSDHGQVQTVEDYHIDFCVFLRIFYYLIFYFIFYFLITAHIQIINANYKNLILSLF